MAIGIYLRVLYALQLDDDILSLTKDDVLGKALQDMNLPHRERASKKKLGAHSISALAIAMTISVITVSLLINSRTAMKNCTFD